MNLIAALCNIVDSSDFSLKNSDGYVSNLASSQGIPFETFVKTIFCGIRGKPETFVNSNDVFAHNGSTNNPPDAMLKNEGDAIEIKKTEKQKSDIILNSSLPKTKIHYNDKMINSSTQNCEVWESRDLLYVIGHVPKGGGNVKSMFFFYGDCFAKANDFYKKKFEEIKSRVNSTGEISEKGNEYGTLKDVDELGNGVYMRVRPINGMHSPWKIFEKHIDDVMEPSKFAMVCIMRKEKFDSFLEMTRVKFDQLIAEKKNLEKKQIDLTNPDFPNETIPGVVITFKID